MIRYFRKLERSSLQSRYSSITLPQRLYALRGPDFIDIKSKWVLMCCVQRDLAKTPSAPHLYLQAALVRSSDPCNHNVLQQEHYCHGYSLIM